MAIHRPRSVQYKLDHRKGLFYGISVLCSFVIATLIYIILLQKQLQSNMRSESLAQKAKVDVERNMTAYFAHELRNPLGAIDCALTSMMPSEEGDDENDSSSSLPADVKDLVTGMRLCTSFMSKIKNNLLDARKIEEGKMVLRNDPLSLQALVDDVRRMSLPSVKPGVQLVAVAHTTKNKRGDDDDSSNTINDVVFGDVHLLQQVCRHERYI